MVSKYEKVVSVAIVGDKTFESYVGDFRIRTMLSYEGQLSEDRIRRDLLAGPAEVAAGPNASSIAAAFAFIQARVIEAPTWWTESRGGTGLYDNNLVSELVALISKAQDEQLEALRAKAEEARKKLAEQAPLDKVD